MLQVNGSALFEFFSGNSYFLRVPGFYDKVSAERLSDWALKYQAEDYTNDVVDELGRIQKVTYGVDRIGYPYNSTFGTLNGSPERLRYVQEIEPTMALFHRITGEAGWPPEMLLSLLQKMWPHGAQRAVLEGKEALLGIVRITRPRETILEDEPHIDRPPKELGSLKEFSANIYLSVPPVGGRLMVWPVPELSKSGLGNVKEYLAWVKDQRRLKAIEPLLVRPEIGELILINTERAHGVESFATETRVSVQTFIGYREKTENPLLLWN